MFAKINCHKTSLFSVNRERNSARMKVGLQFKFCILESVSVGKKSRKISLQLQTIFETEDLNNNDNDNSNNKGKETKQYQLISINKVFRLIHWVVEGPL